MSKYRVRLSRPTSESAYVEVEADDLKDAAQKVLDMSADHEWEEDDDAGRVTIGDIEEDVQLLEPTEYLCEWRIEVTASSPQEAARLAEELMVNREDSAWTVTDQMSGDEVVVEAMVEVGWKDEDKKGLSDAERAKYGDCR